MERIILDIEGHFNSEDGVKMAKRLCEEAVGSLGAGVKVEIVKVIHNPGGDDEKHTLVRRA